MGRRAGEAALVGAGRARLAPWLIAVLGGGCSVALKYDECAIDADCVHLATPAHPTLSCSSDHFCVSGVPEERLCAPLTEAPLDGATVTFGILAHLSGPLAASDQGRLAAIRLAAQEVRQLNLKPTIGAVVCDLGSDAEQARRALQAAVGRYQAAAVLGPTDSAMALELAPQVVATGTLMMLGSATALSIRTLVDANLVWRTAPADDLQAIVLMLRMGEWQMMKQDLTFDIAYASSLVPSGLEASLIGVVSEALALSPANVNVFAPGADLKPVAAKLAMGMAPLSVLLSDDDTPALVGALAEWGTFAHATTFLASSSARVPALLAATTDLNTLARVEGTSNALQAGPQTAAFRANYLTLSGADAELTPGAGSTYDAYYVAAAAVGALSAGQPVTGTALAAAMPRLTNARSGNYVAVGPLDFGKAWQALAAGEDVNLNGVSGEIDFDLATGDVVTAPFDVWKVNTKVSPPQFSVIETYVPKAP